MCKPEMEPCSSAPSAWECLSHGTVGIWVEVGPVLGTVRWLLASWPLVHYMAV